MRTKALGMSCLFKRVVAGLMAVAIAVTAAGGLGARRVQAAVERVIADDNATAYIYDDGSGYIEMSCNFTDHYPLTQINGVALKDIITFNDGGYIDTFYTTSNTIGTSGLRKLVIENTYPYKIFVHGCGPEGLFNGAGYLHFTDQTNDTYDLSIWSSSETWHCVRYKSDHHMITRISWNS